MANKKYLDIFRGKTLLMMLFLYIVLCFFSFNQACANDKGNISNLLLKNLELHKVARLLSEGSGRTIIVSSKAADTKVTVFLEEVSTIDAIKSICRAYQLWYKEDSASGIIEITTLEDYRNTADIYSEEVLEVIPIRYPQVQKIGDVIKDIFQDRVVWVSPATDDYVSDRIDGAMNRMYMIKDTVEEDYQDNFGNTTNINGYNNYNYNNRGAVGTNRTNTAKDEKRRTDNMIQGNLMMKSPEDLKDLTGAQLYNLTKRNRRSFASIVGRPGAVYISAMVDTNSLILRSLDKNAINKIKKVIEQLDKPTSQVLIEIKILDVRIGRDKALGVDWLFSGFSDQALGRANALPGSPSIQNTAGLNASLNSSGNSSVNLNAAVADIDPRTAVFAVVSDTLNFRIKALEENGSLVVLGTPTLIVADGEASQLFVGKESTILTEVKVERSTRGDDEQFTDTTVTPTTERVKVGTSLFITPQIHADKTVTIRIFQKSSELGDQKEIRYGGYDENYFITQDVDSRSVTTTVIASDGNIVAVSGLINERKDNLNRYVPGLSKIPLVGKLFSSKEKSNSRNELMVLVRPFVLIAPDQAERVTKNFLKRNSIHPSAKDDLPELGVGRVGDGDNTVLEDKDKFLDEEIEDWIRNKARKIKIYQSGGECRNVSLNVLSASKLIAKAVTLENKRKYIEAVAAYKEAEINSSDDNEKNTAALGAARCLVALGKYDAALMALDDYSSKSGSEQERLKLALAGEILLRMRNPQTAESTLEMALAQIQLPEANPEWVGTVCANLGKTYLLNKKPDKARKIYKIASTAFTVAGDRASAADCLEYSDSCLQK